MDGVAPKRRYPSVALNIPISQKDVVFERLRTIQRRLHLPLTPSTTLRLEEFTSQLRRNTLESRGARISVTVLTQEKPVVTVRKQSMAFLDLAKHRTEEELLNGLNARLLFSFPVALILV